MLTGELIPQHLKVTDGCQHLHAAEKRLQLCGSGNQRAESSNESTEGEIESPTSRFSSGKLSHQLKLRSVYPHVLSRLKGAKEVTTLQDNWVTVDYIFYKYY